MKISKTSESILVLSKKGFTIKEIAANLSVKSKTVNNALYILRKNGSLPKSNRVKTPVIVDSPQKRAWATRRANAGLVTTTTSTPAIVDSPQKRAWATRRANAGLVTTKNPKANIGDVNRIPKIDKSNYLPMNVKGVEIFIHKKLLPQFFITHENEIFIDNKK